MSKSIETGVYDLQVKVNGVPASTEEYDEMAKEVGACLATAIDNDLQHIWKGNFRKSLRAAIEKNGVPAKDDETDATHYKRTKALAANGEAPFDVPTLVALAHEIASTVDYSTGGGSASRIGQTWLNKAGDYLEKITNPDQWAAFMSNITSRNPGFQFDLEDDGVTPTQQSVALALKTEDARVRAEAEAAIFG